jgi:predicted permease
MRWSRRNRDQDLQDEIQAHFAIEVKQRMERGETREQAERAARREFGNLTVVKEVTRATWGLAWLDSLFQDGRYALRMMRKTPAFTAIAVVTLAIGIGANTAIFGVVKAALFESLPFPEPDRLVRIAAVKNGRPAGAPSPMDMRDIAAAARSFQGMVVYDRWRKNVSGILGSNDAEEMVIGLIPPDFFKVLGVQPLSGRLFTAAESRVGKHYVASISQAFWRDRFAADPQVLGKTLRINAETYTIVAVMPRAVPEWMDEVSAPVSIWTPFAFDDIWTESARGPGTYFAFGRLKHGVSLESARAEVSTIAARLARDHPLDQGMNIMIEPLVDARSGPVKPVVLMLAGAVGMVLLIACSNLAGLLLARNSARSREIAVRAALGAGRWRLVRQLLCETLLLSLFGGAVGLLFCAGVVAFARTRTGTVSPYTTASRVEEFLPAQFDPHILLFAFAICVVTALLFGLAPALAGTKVSLSETLKEGGRGSTGFVKQQFRQALVIAEIALSLVLIVVAGLLTRSIVRLQSQNPGFTPDHMLKAHFYLPPVRYSDAASITRFCERLNERLRALPGVVDASVTTVFPPHIGWTQMFTIEGHPVSRLSSVPVTRWGVVDERYLQTMRIPLIAGRDLAQSDTAASTSVALVSEEFVRRYFPNENPLGRRIFLGPPPGVMNIDRADPGLPSGALTIVGVLADIMNDGMGQPPAPQMFALFRQQPALNFGFKDLVLRTRGDPERLGSEVAQVLKSLDADLPLGEVQSMSKYMANETASARFATGLLALFAAVGTVLAAIGTYGVVSYLVAQRTQELGVRLALGASSVEILWMILRQGLSMGVAGLAVGIAGSIAAQRLVATLLYRMSGTDLVMIAACSTILLAVVAAASIIPARRATRIDPLRALRAD